MVLFVDEVSLVRGPKSPMAMIERALHYICLLGDRMVTDAGGRRALSLFTTLHTGCMQDNYRRPLALFQPDQVDPRTVIPEAVRSEIVRVHGSDNTQTVFDMCLGHPRRLVKAVAYLKDQTAPAITVSILIKNLRELLVQDGMTMSSNIAHMCPVMLDLLVPGPVAGGVASEGHMLVEQGLYANRFKHPDVIAFIPTTTAWQLEHYLEAGSKRPSLERDDVQIAVEHVEDTCYALREAVVEVRLTSLEGFLSRAIHHRLETFRAIPKVLQTFGSVGEPEVTLVSTGERNAYTQHVGLFEVSENQRFRLCRLVDAEIVQELAPLHVMCWESLCPSAKTEGLQREFGVGQSLVCQSNKQNNKAADGIAYLWVRVLEQLEMLRLLTRVKQGTRQYLSRRLVRTALHDLQNLAQASFATTPRKNIVLVLALVCTEERDINVETVLHRAGLKKRFTCTDAGKRKSLPAIRYPVVLLGRDDVYKMLGRSFGPYLHQRFLGRLQPDEQDQECGMHDAAEDGLEPDDEVTTETSALLNSAW